jgi:hypothetical protein
MTSAELAAQLRERLRKFVAKNEPGFTPEEAATILDEVGHYSDEQMINLFRASIRYGEALQIAAECGTEEEWCAEIKRLSSQLS